MKDIERIKDNIMYRHKVSPKNFKIYLDDNFKAIEKYVEELEEKAWKYDELCK